MTKAAAKLTWKRAKDGSITVVIGKWVYKVRQDGKSWHLTVDGASIFKGAKEECKGYAKRHAEGKVKAKAELDEALVAKVASTIWYAGRDWHLVHPMARKILKELGVKSKALTRGILAAAEALTNKWLRNPKLRGKLDKRFGRYRPKAAKPVEEPKPPEPKEKVVEEMEECPIRKPKVREARKRPRMFAVTGECPIRLEGPKWKQIREWAEAVRDSVEESGRFCTVEALIHWGRLEVSSFEKGQKVARRLKELYREEWEHDQTVLQYMVERSGRQEEPAGDNTDGTSPRKKGGQKDGFGQRIGTESAKINAVLSRKWQTAEEIKTAAAVQRSVTSHLAFLIKRGLVKRRVEDGVKQYRLSLKGKEKI